MKFKGKAQLVNTRSLDSVIDRFRGNEKQLKQKIKAKDGFIEDGIKYQLAIDYMKQNKHKFKTKDDKRKERREK